jgi:hypothetical protein
MEQGITWPTNMLIDDNFFWYATHGRAVKNQTSIFQSHNVDSVLPHHPEIIIQSLNEKTELQLFGSTEATVTRMTARLCAFI